MADVIIQNFRPGVVERLGIDEDAVRAVKPDIIYASISGFGEKGPFAHKPVYDPIVQALSGLTPIQAGSDEERPRLVRTCLLYTSPSPRDRQKSRMPSSA